MPTDRKIDGHVLVANLGRALIGTDAFQEADIAGITVPITKHNYLVQDGADLPRVLAEALSRPRPQPAGRSSH